MATNATWTVVFEDKRVIKNSGAEAGTPYTIDDDSFWNQSKFSNIWAIQHENNPTSDQVEYKDITPNSAYDAGVLGSFNDFITKWDAAHLAQLQAGWDNNNATEDEAGNPISETEAEKIARLGARPTSYSSL
tara:strand:+ start:543 stop:938 length:396 start_codon:yes stop_codon:yes gene_type:complete